MFPCFGAVMLLDGHQGHLVSTIFHFKTRWFDWIPHRKLARLTRFT